VTAPNTFTAAGTPATAGDGAPPQLTHAYLQVRDPPTGGGTASPGPERGRIEFQFNPRELSLTKSAKWKRDAQRGAKKSGVPEFTGAEPVKLTVEMFFDATDTMDASVVRWVEALFACCTPTEQTRQNRKASPPWVILHWGDLVGFPSVVTTVSTKYTLFTPGGTPVRAVCTVTMEEISGEQPGQNPTSGGLAARDVHVLAVGDTLEAIAYRAYGDPTRWRDLADANGIDDPMRLPPGTALLVPAPEEFS
jgi:nucleoid-associated protein YgaU